MIKSFLQRKRKLVRGALFSFRRFKPYNPREFWDDAFYTSGVSDSKTLNPKREAESAYYHYASVELLILRHLINNNIVVRNLSILDIGSGAGHWIDFYSKLGARKIVGIDISKKSSEYLRTKYGDRVDIHHGIFQEFLERNQGTYGIINAIGIMFHVVEDTEWERGIAAIARSLNPGGLFVTSGYFGVFGNLNVQVRGNQVNKRLRSRWRWAKTLHSYGFREIQIYHNPSYLHIEQSQPENNLLVACRP
jgi:SAM-dependent methyltransferase